MRIKRKRSFRVLTIGSLLVWTGVACDAVDTPGAPSALEPSVAGGSTPGAATVTRDALTSPFGGNAVPLVEQPGSTPAGGSGRVNVVQTGEPGVNQFHVIINVHGGPPDTDLYLLQRVDIGLGDQQGDGVCDSAALGFPPPPSADLLHTSAAGAGALHIDRFRFPDGAFGGAFDTGAQTDVMYQIVDLTQTFVLRSPCFTLTGK